MEQEIDMNLEEMTAGESKAVRTVGGVRSKRNHAEIQNTTRRMAHGGVEGRRSHELDVIDEIKGEMERDRADGSRDRKKRRADGIIQH